MALAGFSERIDRAREASANGDITDAANFFHQAAVIAREEGLTTELAYALRHAAQCEIEIGHFDRAHGNAEEALRIYRGDGGKRDLNQANTIRLIALAGEGLGNAAQAREDWRAARAVYAEYGIAEGVEECDEHLR